MLIDSCIRAPAAPNVAAKIKTLKWNELTSPREDGPAEPTGDWEAACGFGEYSICLDQDEAMSETPWCVWSPDANIGHYSSIEAAKAAAQSEFNARISSFLSTEVQHIAEMNKAIEDVLSERKRQIEAEGFGPSHDDRYPADILASAAVAYAMHKGDRKIRTENGFQLWRVFWPWDAEWFKPTDRRRDLVKSAALIIAEIERIDRLLTATSQPSEKE